MRRNFVSAMRLIESKEARRSEVYMEEEAAEKKCGWSKPAKEKCFDELYKRCFDRNFGTLSKAEFEALLFHHYLADLRTRKGNNAVSDYEIGRELGLTIARVRLLRERDQLKWPEDFDWREELLDRIPHAKYDEKTDLIKFLVPDVNVLKNFVINWSG